MTDNIWYAKLRAFGIHFGATLLVAALAGYLVFRLWLPHPFAEMLGGLKLFWLVVACDLVLGPLISLVIYNPRKSRRELLTDYAVVVVIQLAALAYGLFTVAQVRPAFLAFTVDRYVVVSAGELPAAELAKATEPDFRQPRWTGYRTVYVDRHIDPELNQSLIISALAGGRDLQHLTANYRPVAQHQADILRAAKPLQALRARFPDHAAALDAAVTRSGHDAAQLRWLAVQAQSQAGPVFWTALIDSQTALPVAWLNLDPL